MKRSITILISILLFACTDSGRNELSPEEIASVTYTFQDASVPPEYHRSYFIKLDFATKKIICEVDSYGDVLNHIELESTNDQLNEITVLINQIDLNCAIPQSQPCSGGASEDFSVVLKNRTVHDLFLDHCADVEDYPEECGNVRALIDRMKSLIPEFEAMLQ